MLGKGAFEAWKEGKFTVGDISKTVQDDVWDTMRVPKTLKELAE